MRYLIFIFLFTHATCMEQDSQPLFFDEHGGGGSQEPSMSVLLATDNGTRGWRPAPPETYWRPATITPLDTTALDFGALRVYDNPRDRMHGVMGFLFGDQFIVSPFQVNNAVEPFTTITVVDGETRDPQHGEIVFQRMITNPTRTPVVLVNAATLQANATTNTVVVQGGVYVPVNLDRVHRDEHGALIIAAMDVAEVRLYTDDDGHSQIAIADTTEFGLNMNHIVLNPSALADAAPLGTYNDFHSEVIRRFEAIFGAGSFMQRLWTRITNNVLNIHQQLLDHNQHLTAGINPANQPDFIVTLLQNQARDTLHRVRNALIDRILRDDETAVVDRLDVQFIRDNFDALVNLVNDVDALRGTLPATEALYTHTVVNAPLYGVNFRERGPTSPELEAFETTAIRDIATRLFNVMPIDTWREVVRMFRYDDPVAVMDALALPGDLRDELNRAHARIGVLMNRVIRSGGRQLPGADALRDERAAHAQTRADVGEGRASVTRLTQELDGMKQRHDQLTREIENKLKKAEEKGHKEGVEKEREEAMRVVAKLEAEIAKLKKIMEEAEEEEEEAGGHSLFDEDAENVSAVVRRAKKGARKAGKRARE
jgi:hypothetical protein